MGVIYGSLAETEMSASAKNRPQCSSRAAAFDRMWTFYQRFSRPALSRRPSWNLDNQQQKPQQYCHRNESGQNANRNANKRPTAFHTQTLFAHDYLSTACPQHSRPVDKEQS
jgi:hypothetical protein